MAGLPRRSGLFSPSLTAVVPACGQPLRDKSNRIRPRTPGPARADPAIEAAAHKVVSLPKPRVHPGNLGQVALRASAGDERAGPGEPRSTRHPARGTAVTPTGDPSVQPSTPRRPSSQPPRVVETCPTPPSAARRNSRRTRRRSLVATELDDDEGSDGDAASLRSIGPSGEAVVKAPRPDRSLPSGAHGDAGGVFAPPITVRDDSHDTGEAAAAASASYGPGTSEPVIALLSRTLPVVAPRPRSRRVSCDTCHSTTPTLQSVRLVRSDRAAVASVDFGHGTGPALVSLPPTPRYHRPSSVSPPLRSQPSTATLFSWDLAHLPAPRTPREHPYRVPWRKVLLPTSCLGGGRGSGMYGDQWGAVERKVSRTGLPAGRADEEADRAHRFERRSRWPPSSRLIGGETVAAARLPSIRAGSSGLDTPSAFVSGSPAPYGEPESRRRGSLWRRLSRGTGSIFLFRGDSSSTAPRPPAVDAGLRTSRRRSLVASIFGAGNRSSNGSSGGCSKSSSASPSAGSSVEHLNQWVPVVVR